MQRVSWLFPVTVSSFQCWHSALRCPHTVIAVGGSWAVAVAVVPASFCRSSANAADGPLTLVHAYVYYSV